jgi:cellulose synthase/poly-beta-1,6-N-acetylglucosamine synthase-like glycosyltransferase
MLAEIILWVSILGLIFIYAGYGLVVAAINKFKPTVRDANVAESELPEVSILIAAFNEEEIIKEKIENTLSLHYPDQKLKLYVVSDGSTDKTNEIVSGFKNVTLLYQPARKGKSAAINRAMQFIQEPVTVFTDANVMINKEGIVAIARHYANEKIGGVSGEKVVMHDERAAAASTEGVYWKYESFLKKQDARLYSIAGAAGEMFSIRTSLFEIIPEDTLLDDFQISMNIIRKGYRVIYEPAAFASENPSLNIAEEYKRKVRIAAGGIQIIERNTDIFNPFNYGIFSFQFLIHRVTRWTIAPVFIVTALLSNMFLINYSNFYTILFVLQLAFHLAALAGWQLGNRQIKVKALHVPFYFEFMHYCVVMGWIRYFKGNQKATWQKATRLSYN